MRVLMLGWEFPPHISGGLGTACRGLASGLLAHGVEVTFFVPHAFGDEDAEGVRLLGVDRVLAANARHAPGTAEASAPPPGERLLRVLGVDSPLRPYLTGAEYEALVREMGAKAEGTRPASPTREPEPGTPAPVSLGLASASRHYGRDLFQEVARFAALSERAAAAEPFDLVHAHDWMTMPAGVLAARTRERPLIVHVHSCEYDRAGDHADPRIVAIEQEGLDASQLVVCVSHYTAGVLASRYRVDELKLRVLHNAVTQKEQQRQWRQKKPFPEPVVLFLGRVTFQKGPDYFLEAAAKVVADEPGVRFVMGGTGDMLPRMIEAAAKRGLARNVFFTGFVSGEDVERIYAMADVYVMPSVSEPFGITPLEAMALDVPVIVSRQSGVSEVLEHALKFDYWNVDDLAAKILRVLREPQLRRSLVEPGRDEIARMRWDLRGEHLKRIYAEVLS